MRLTETQRNVRESLVAVGVAILFGLMVFAIIISDRGDSPEPSGFWGNAEQEETHHHHHHYHTNYVYDSNYTPSSNYVSTPQPVPSQQSFAPRQQVRPQPVQVQPQRPSNFTPQRFAPSQPSRPTSTSSRRR